MNRSGGRRSTGSRGSLRPCSSSTTPSVQEGLRGDDQDSEGRRTGNLEEDGATPEPRLMGAEIAHRAQEDDGEVHRRGRGRGDVHSGSACRQVDEDRRHAALEDARLVAARSAQAQQEVAGVPVELAGQCVDVHVCHPVHDQHHRGSQGNELGTLRVRTHRREHGGADDRAVQQPGGVRVGKPASHPHTLETLCHAVSLGDGRPRDPVHRPHSPG